MTWEWARYLGYGAGIAAVVLFVRRAFGGPSSGHYLDTSGGTPPPKWSLGDYRALQTVADRLGVPSPNLLAVLRSESNLDPAAMYPGGIARGLNQITEAGRPAAGLSESQFEEFQTWSVGEQLPFVERSMSVALSGAKPQTAGGLYAYNFLPARARLRGTAPTTVLADVAEWPVDSGLDTNHDGEYEVSDLSAHLSQFGARKKDGSPVDPRYLGALQALRDATGNQALSPTW